MTESHGKPHRRYPTIEQILDRADGLDDQGLLDVDLSADKARQTAPSHQTRREQGFEAINAFVDAYGRVPMADGGPTEHQLAKRLEVIRSNPGHRTALNHIDRHGLLADPAEAQGGGDANGETPPGASTQTPPTSSDPDDHEQWVRAAEAAQSIDDIFASDPFGLLDEPDDSIFTPRHVSFESDRAMPEEIAQRTPCEDFDSFQGLFERTRQKIADGSLEVARFRKETQIEEGDFFILGGVLCLVDSIETDTSPSGERYNPRMRVIFDNATEANLLLRSLARALYKDDTGRRVIPDLETVNKRMSGISHHDQRSGVIYILRSKSEHPAIQGIQDLYKVGYTEGSLDERIKNAEKQPAFLEGPVTVAASYTCYNLNVNRFESLVHAFLAQQRLDVTLTSSDGKQYHPREWFVAPLETIKDVVERVVDGTIRNYRIDQVTNRLVPKDSDKK